MLRGPVIGPVAGYRVHRNDRRHSTSHAERSAAAADGSSHQAGIARRHHAVKAPQPAVPGRTAFLVFGGSENLGDSYGAASPPDCVGVVYMTQKSAYQSADVKNIAGELWRHHGRSVKVDEVDESVVSLATTADADALFAKFAVQWTACDGKTLTVPSGTFVQNAITDVSVADSVVVATVSLGPGAHSILASIPEARAVGVRGNCLVEVEVTFFAVTYPSDQGSADINTSAIDIAHAMIDKIGALS